MSKVDLMPPKQRVQFNMSLVHFQRLDKPIIRKVMNPITMQPTDELTLESEKELDQWYFEFKKFPLPADVVDKALDQVKEMIKFEMKKQGFIYER